MEIDHPHFWKWVKSYKPDVILFQDQNIYGKSKMQEETSRLKKMGIKLINYPDWIRRGDIEQYKGFIGIHPFPKMGMVDFHLLGAINYLWAMPPERREPGVCP